MTISAADAPDPPASLDLLESLMDAAWPALESTTAHGWKLRSAGSVTQRANSVWPAPAVADLPAMLAAATTWYGVRRQPVILQITHREEHSALEAFLDERRYSRQSETLIMTAVLGPVPERSFAGKIHLSDTPSPEWLDLWWSVDGRGGGEAKAIAKRILLGAPAIYASSLDGQGRIIGTGRLALIDQEAGPGWGGINAMAVLSPARRQGIATAILNALIAAGNAAGISSYWLMVTAANAGAQELYRRAGFAELGRYHYRQAPLRRAPGAC